MNDTQLNGPSSAMQPTSGDYNQLTNNIPTSPQPTMNSNDVPIAPAVTEELKKKKHTGFIIGIIVAILLLLGGGAFAAIAIVKNQPEQIVLESFNNLLNAQQVAVSGTFNYTPKNKAASTLGQVTVTLDSKSVQPSSSSSIDVSIEIPRLSKTIEFGLGEIMLKDGIFYSRISGVTTIYEEILSDMLDEYISSSLQQSISQHQLAECTSVSNDDITKYRKCLEDYRASETIDPATMQIIDDVVVEIKDTIKDIIAKIDNQWVEFSIKDILNSDFVNQYLDLETKTSINKSYDCTIEMKNNIPQYSEEFSNLYQEHEFVVVEPSADSFYKISLKSGELASYMNALPSTKAYADLASCNGATDISNTGPNVSVDDTKEMIDNLPNIYAKFDGFLSHHLTEIKIENNKDTEDYIMNANLNFSYPSNLEIVAPTDSRPFIDLLQEIISDMTELSQKMNSL